MAIIMSQTRKKQIAEALIKGGFRGDSFELTVTDDTIFELIYKKESSYKFYITSDPTFGFKFYNYSPASDGRMSTRGKIESWATVVKGLDNWVHYLKLELEVGDPWSEFNNLDNDTFNIGDRNDKSFTPEDVKIIDEKLDIILEGLKKFDIDLERIKTDLDYLKRSSEKVSKKDWGLLVKGSVMGWGLDKAVPAETLHHIWDLIVQTFSSQNLLG